MKTHAEQAGKANLHAYKRITISKSKMFNSITLYNSSKKYLQFSHFRGKFEFLVKSKMAANLAAICERYNP